MTPRKDSKVVFNAVLFGLLFYLVFLIIEPILVPLLSQLSSSLAFMVLGLIYSGIEQSGTVLTLDGAKYDVVPACSGSVVLRSIILFGVIIYFLKRKYLKLEFILFVFCLVALSIFSNSLRISTLIIFGVVEGVPLEGLGHDLVGIFYFVVSMLTLICFVSKLDSFSVKAKASPVLSLFLYLLIFFPFLKTCIGAWVNSPFDRHSYLFFILGSGLLFVSMKSGKPVKQFFVQYLVSLAHVLCISAAFLDYNFLWAIALIIVIFI